jgi:hypothetical protein
MTLSAKITESAVVVFPEESGLLLAPAFNAQGIQTIEIPSQPGDPSGHYHFQTALAQLDAERVNERLICIIPGSERGVPLADQLAAHYRVFANDPEHKIARYSKSALATLASKARLKVPWQCAIDTQQDLLALESNQDWPLILKPDASMGSEGVTRCDSFADLQQNFAALHRQTNRLGRDNQRCLVQTYLKGTEYAIDTVSHKGQHRVQAIWQYVKSNPRILGSAPFTSKKLLPARGEIQSALTRYTEQLLDASGIRYGPAHTELVIETPNLITPTLMEMGARMHGGQAAMQLSEWCIGHSQVNACVAAYTAPERFLTRYSETYTLQQHGEIVLLICPEMSLSVSRASAETLRSLASVRYQDIDFTPSSKANQIVGMLILAHQDEAQIEHDVNQIRSLEQTKLYLPAASVA